MLTLDIATGIPGIKRIREENRRGWHILTDPDQEQFPYSREAFVYTVHQMNRNGYQLADVIGNNLYFTKK